MPRLSRLFARKQEIAALDEPATVAVWPTIPLDPPIPLDPHDLTPADPLPAAAVVDPAAPPAVLGDPQVVEQATSEHVRATVCGDDRSDAAPAGFDLPYPRANLSADALIADDFVADRRAGVTLIGGEEEDIVPVIPDTTIEFSASGSAFDEEAAMQAAIDALMAACGLMVARVKAIRSLHDGTQIVAALIDLAGELDARYAEDWGVVRRNGLELVLNEVRDTIPEGDQFILESLEDGQGGLTAEHFLRDLRTIAVADRPRMVANYADFLVFVLQCVLRQYLSVLQDDPARLHDVTARLDYLIDGIRDTVLARINGIP